MTQRPSSVETGVRTRAARHEAAYHRARSIDRGSVEGAEPMTVERDGDSAGAGRSLRIAMAVYGDIRHDSRVRREAASLAAAGHQVTIHCLGAEDDVEAAIGHGVRVVARVPSSSPVLPGSRSPFRDGSRSRIPRALGRARWLAGYVANLAAWGAAVLRDDRSAEVWHVHDFAALAAIAWRRPRGTRLVYDVHDLFLSTGSGARLNGPLRAVIARLERRWARRADAVVTVNAALAEVLRRRLGLVGAPVVVHNCPPLVRTTPDRARLRLVAGVNGPADGSPIVLHHGLLAHNRGLETLVAAMRDPRLAGVHLVLLGGGELRDHLVALGAGAEFGGRLHVLEPVPPEALLGLVAGADVGAIALPPATENLRLSTPNKLFECLAAGVPVVVSDFPAVRAIVCDGPDAPLGVTCDPDDPSSIAAAIAMIVRADPAQRAALRTRCERAARERWNWETEVGRLVAAYGALAGEAVTPRTGPPTAALGSDGS